jgi:methionyl-tRNA formyltransferase
MRIIFMGTPDFALPSLAALLDAGHEVAAVYTQPPRRAGRGRKERPSPVHMLAMERGLEVRAPANMRLRRERERLEALRADLGVVVAYGQILTARVLSSTRHGFLNLHGSLLPRWRGAAPIQRAIMAGDKRSGVEVMRMEKGLDAGPVCLSREVEIGPDMTAGELHDILSAQGAELLVEALALLEKGELCCRPQSDEGVTYAHRIEKSESRIDWSGEAGEIHNRIRGLSPFPGAWFELEREDGKKERIKVLRSSLASHDEDEAGDGAKNGTKESGGKERRPGLLLDDELLVACGRGALRLTELQRAGKKPMKAEELLRGLPLPAGRILL